MAGRAESFEAADLGFYVVGFEVEVRPLFAGLGVGGVLQQDAYVGVGQSELAVHVAAGGADGLLGGSEGGGPEGDGLVEVVNVIDEVAEPDAVDQQPGRRLIPVAALEEYLAALETA